MASVVLYFQIHQPWRLRRYSVFDTDPHYFDVDANREILEKVATKCYRPTTELILDLLKRHGGDFRVAYSLTGSVIDQLEAWAPDVLDTFKQLADTGHCEFLAETYDHSLAFLYSREEFRAQVERHTARIEELFGLTPRIFRNTELIYNNDVAQFVHGMTDESGARRFDGILAEGVDRILDHRTPNRLYRPPATGEGPSDRPFGLLLRNYRLSDDIAFRFSNREWAEHPLSAEKFARWINQINGMGDVCNLFMDYETFGEHQWTETGIFDFLRDLPGAILTTNKGENNFRTPSEALAQHDATDTYDSPHMTSWADTERDLSAWLGNAMQTNAQTELYRLETKITKAIRDATPGAQRSEAEAVLRDWRRLTTSDHFYYMCTKYFADGDVHKYFNPYDSPYDSYINFMNVLDNLRTRIGMRTEASV